VDSRRPSLPNRPREAALAHHAETSRTKLAKTLAAFKARHCYA
jgi:hypothetical protein